MTGTPPLLTPTQDNTLPRTALVFLILIKLALLAAIGPITSPDTDGYATIAAAMRSGQYWGTLDLADPAVTPLFARAPGYPALMALAGGIAGAAGPWLVALAQIALGVVAALALYRFALALLRHTLPALLVTVAYATGLPLLLDQTVLTDGPYASLLVIVLARLGRAAVRREPMPWGALLTLGFLLAAALLLRESTTQVMVVLLPVIAVAAWAIRPGVLPRLGMVVLLVLPVLAAGAAVSGFNQWRTGTAFLSSGLRTALMVPMVQMQARGAPVFAQDGPVPQALRAGFTEWRNEQLYGAVARAEQTLGVTPVAMASAVRALFLRSIAAFPGTYARVVLAELRPRYFALSVAPAASVGTLIGSRGGTLVAASQAIPAGGIGRYLTLSLYTSTAFLAGLCWLAMAGGLTILTVTRLRHSASPDIRLALLIALALSHIGLMLLFALVHIEARYLVPLQFVPPLAAAYVLMACWEARRVG